MPATGLVIDHPTRMEPGFVRCEASCEVNGRRYRGLATAGFAVEKIMPTQTEPADFDAFWQTGKDALAKIPMASQTTPWPEQCTPELEVYHVGFQNVGGSMVGSSRMYGVLCVPKGKGPFPAVLRIPGAGVRQYFWREGDRGERCDHSRGGSPWNPGESG